MVARQTDPILSVLCPKAERKQSENGKLEKKILRRILTDKIEHLERRNLENCENRTYKRRKGQISMGKIPKGTVSITTFV